MLTKRRADLRRHAGEISFPGRPPGRRGRGPADDGAARGRRGDRARARRRCALLGELPPTSTFATNYVIHPFVGRDPRGHRLAAVGARGRRGARAAAGARSARAGRGRASSAAASRFETDAYVVDEHLIWGATARILEHLLERLDGAGLTLVEPRPGPPQQRPTRARRQASSAAARAGCRGAAPPTRPGRSLWPGRWRPSRR